MKHPYIPLGCDQQGRLQTGLRYDFTTSPEAHLRASRDSRSMAERATPIEGPFKPDEDMSNHWLWWVLAIVMMVMMFSAVSVWRVVA